MISGEEEHAAAFLGDLEQDLVELEQQRAESCQETAVAIGLHSRPITQNEVKPVGVREGEKEGATVFTKTTFNDVSH